MASLFIDDGGVARGRSNCTWRTCYTCTGAGNGRQTRSAVVGLSSVLGHPTAAADSSARQSLDPHGGQARSSTCNHYL